VCVVDGVWLCSTSGGLEALVRLAVTNNVAVTNIVYNSHGMGRCRCPPLMSLLRPVCVECGWVAGECECGPEEEERSETARSLLGSCRCR